MSVGDHVRASSATRSASGCMFFLFSEVDFIKIGGFVDWGKFWACVKCFVYWLLDRSRIINTLKPFLCHPVQTRSLLCTQCVCHRVRFEFLNRLYSKVSIITFNLHSTHVKILHFEFTLNPSDHLFQKSNLPVFLIIYSFHLVKLEFGISVNWVPKDLVFYLFESGSQIFVVFWDLGMATSFMIKVFTHFF